MEFADAMPCALKNSDLVLANGQNMETSIATKKWKKGLQVETVNYHNQFVETKWHTIVVKNSR
jgi:hypothetical protein